jgi:serine/threonine protein kinase/WD40 repeat protein
VTSEAKPTIDPLGATSATDPDGRNLAVERSPALDATASAERFTPLQPGESSLRPFGPFTRVEPLSEQGAMGFVARGYNEAFDRWELLKFLRPELADSAELVRQFFREGRVLAKLSHPNVVQVFAIYALDGRPCLAMEFLEGESLQAYVDKAGGRLPVATWHELFLGAARGLAAAHALGLLHRDIKPENLFVVAERAGAAGGLKLIDFGLATVDRSRRHRESVDPSLVAGTSGGTPLYMAPELWKGEEASTRSDLYALGLSFFVALSGRLPFVGSTVPEVALTVCSDEPFPDARETRPELPASLALALKRTMSKRKEERFATADELVAALVAAASAARPRKVPGSGPYKGLLPYGPAERDVFFGRDTEIAEVLERLRANSGVVLVGPSGSGKSSLAQAGLVPAIEDGALGGGVAYGTAVVEPRGRPLQALAAALARKMGLTERDVVAFLRKQPASLGEALRAALPAESGVLLVVEHLDELSRGDGGEARDFAAAIASMLEIGSAPLRVLATLRADRMDPLFSLEPLRPLLTRGFYPVRPLAGDALRRAMGEPALAAGYRLEDPRIVEEVVEDVTRSPSALPLLSFAMSAWWEARDEASHTLPAAVWRSLGGLAGALMRHADQVLEAMSVEERRAADQLLVRLVSAERTRTRVARGLLLDAAAAGPHASRALERLVENKLVVESGEEVELAHEALIEQWPRLRALLLSSGEDRAFRERVAAAARQWDVQGRPHGALWSDEQAIRLARWFAATNAPLDQVELAFVEAVRRRTTRRRIVLRGAIGAVVLTALSFGLVAMANEREMEKRLRAATARAEEKEKAYVHAESRRLKGVAAANLDRDPTATLRMADASYELEHDPSLDVLAWDARARGIAVPLPVARSHGGAPTPTQLVRVSQGQGFIAAASGGEVAVLSPNSAVHPSFHAADDAGATVRAMTWDGAGGTLIVGASDGEIAVAPLPSLMRRRVATCPGPVRRIWGELTGTFFALCGPAGHAEVLWVNPTTSASRNVFDGDVGAAAVARTLRALVILKRDGTSSIVDERGQSKDGPSLSLTGEVTALDVSPAGDSATVGESNGDVVLVPLDATKAKSTTTPLDHHAGPIVAVSRGPSGATLTIGEDRVATISVGGASRSFDVASPAYAWIEPRNAVALVGRSGGVQVISLETRESTGELRSPEHDVISLASDARGEWLLTGSQDGALQGFNLDQGTVALTQGSRPVPPSACTLSPDGAAVACASAGSAQVRGLLGSSGIPVARPPLVLPDKEAPDHLALEHGGTRLFLLTQGAVARGDERPSGLLASTTAAMTTDQRLVVAGENAEGRPLLALLPFALDARPAPAVLPARTTALAWGEASHKLFAAGADRRVRRIDALSGAIAGEVSLEAVLAPDDAITSLVPTDEGSGLAVGTRSGKVLAYAQGAKGFTEVANVRAQVSCVAWGRAGHALVVAADRKAFVISTDLGIAFTLWTTAAPIAQCARSPDEDRFSFVGTDGTAWVKALDLSGVVESYVPPDPGAADAMPTLATWKGLPVGLVR